MPSHKKINLPRTSRITHLLGCEQLELRQLLASDMGTTSPYVTSAYAAKQEMSSQDKWVSGLEAQLAQAAPSHAYYVDGKPEPMVIYPTRLALKLAGGAKQADLQGWGLNFERDLADGYAVYGSANDAPIDRLSLEASGIVDDAVSVFFIQSSRSEAVVLDEIIVALKPGVTEQEYFSDNTLFSHHQPLLGTPDQFIATVANGKGEIALHVANAIDEDSRLQFTTPNFYQNWQKYYTPNDPRFTNLWHLHNTGQSGGLIDADVDMPEAWDVNPGGSSSMVIGVIDDGVSAHPDLNRWQNPGEVVDGLDNDNNGWVNDLHGWNFVGNNSASENTTVGDMHGTSVAGVAAATGDNGIGVTGASYKAKVLSARIFEGSGVASDANIAGALYYAAGRTANGLGTWKAADIVNSSWGGGGNSAAINAALTWGTTNGNLGKGVAFFFATGNNFGAVIEPALQSVNIPGVFAIGAINNKGLRSEYSNFGPAVDLVTPSSDTRPGYLAIDTTDRVGADGYATGDYTDTGTTGFGGTSSATPLSTGIAALVLSQASDQGVVLTPAQLRSYLRMNTELVGGVSYDPVTGKNDEFGYGRLNAASAVSNLNKREISVLSSTHEFQSGESLSLGSTWLDESSDTVFRIRNQGTLPLNLGTITLGAGPFSIVNPIASSTLALGEFVTFTVRFTPTAGGAASTTLTINSNDANEAVFSVNLSAVGLVANISGFVFQDWDGDNSFDPQDRPLQNETVYLDINNNGVYDWTPTLFTNTTATPLVDGGVVTSTMAVSGLPRIVADVNVRINLTHNFDSDLRISLISPNGTTVVLASNVGSADDNFTNTVFDDEAAIAIASGSAPFTGTFRPAQSLTAFDNAGGNGTWTLKIEDQVADDTGNLISWDLVIVSNSEPVASTRASGGYSILDAPTGSYVLRARTQAGWTVAQNVQYNVNLSAPTDIIRRQNFGLGQNNHIYGLVFDDYDADGIWDNTESGVASAALYLDSNANGTFDTSTKIFSAAPSLLIPDLTTRTSTISATGVSGLVTDVNVKVNFTTTFDADLDVFLIAPDGTRVELFTDVGASGDNFVNTILDDQAATAVTAGTAPFTGSYRPEGSLATLNGKNGNGVWTLEIADDTSGDLATLNNWEITIEGGETYFPVAAVGVVEFPLTTGSQGVGLLKPTGFRNTLPSTGSRTVNVAGAPMFDQRFGIRPNNTAPTDIGLSATTVTENSASGTTVGSFNSSDADFGDTFTYTLVTGTGATGNNQFTIDGSGRLKTSAVFNYESAASYSIRVRSADQNGLFVEKAFTINVADLVESTGGIVIGNGSSQRSQVDQLQVTFDGATTFDAGAFAVAKRGTGGGVVTTNLAISTNGSGQTVATVTFAGTFTRGALGALSDGYYQLTIDGSKIHRGTQTLDMNGDGVGGDTYVLGAAEADNFFALYGDTNADGLVGIAEFGQFRSTFGKISSDSGYDALFDYGADAAIGIADFGEFRARFGKPKLAF